MNVGELTEEQVKAIRRDPRVPCEIAQSYELREFDIDLIKQKKVWSWVEEESVILTDRRKRTEEEIKAIRGDRRTTAEIARETGICRKQVAKIRRGLSPHKKVNLTDDEIRAIRADRRTTTVVAKQFGIGRNTVWYIQKGIIHQEVE